MVVTNRTKNQFNTDVTAAAATTAEFSVLNSVDVGAATKVTGIEVPAGARVFSVDISVNFNHTTSGEVGTLSYFYGIARSGQSPSTDFPAPQWTAIGLSNLRNQIIFSRMIVVGDEAGMGLRDNVNIKIPKIYQRIRDGDLHFIKIFNQLGGAMSIGQRYIYYQ